MTFKGHGLVYIPVTKKFARFTGGKLETADKETIEFLSKAGYESEGKVPEDEPKAPVKKTRKGQA